MRVAIVNVLLVSGMIVGGVICVKWDKRCVRVKEAFGEPHKIAPCECL